MVPLFAGGVAASKPSLEVLKTGVSAAATVTSAEPAPASEKEPSPEPPQNSGVADLPETGKTHPQEPEDDRLVPLAVKIPLASPELPGTKKPLVKGQKPEEKSITSITAATFLAMESPAAERRLTKQLLIDYCAKYGLRASMSQRRDQLIKIAQEHFDKNRPAVS